MAKIPVRKGDIVWIDLGDIQEVKGHEQAKLRPCVVIRSFEKLELLVIVPLTTKGKSYYTIVEINKSENGLSEDSFALCHQIRSISYERIKRKQGTLSERDLLRITGVLNDMISA
jgi:mRNA interferase MazF